MALNIKIGLREPFAMYGRKGSAPGSATHITAPDKPGAAILEKCALECDYKCSAC